MAASNEGPLPSTEHRPAQHHQRHSEASTSWLRRLLPHPLLTFILIGMWLSLINHLSGVTIVAGTLLGIAIPAYTGNFWPDRPTIRSPGNAFVLLCIVLWDILVANLQVAWTILARPSSKLRTHWIAVPIDLRTPEAVATLAATITLTPGTVTCDLSTDGQSLLVHCLDVADPEAEITKIKQRYEKRIQAIFP